MNNAKCPKCGMELPQMLLEAHVEDCDEGPDNGDTPDLTPPVGSIRDFIDDNKDALDDDFLDGLGTADEREGTGGVADISVDSEFDKLVGMLDLSDIGPMVPSVVVTTLDDAELSRRFNETREKLMERGEMIQASTQTGRDLHSERAAYIIELRRRGLLT